MKKEIICGIYKITSPSGKIYIGQSNNITKRWTNYKSISKSNDGQPKLKNSFDKYGVNTHIFEVIEECCFENLDCRERYWQDFYNATNTGLNCVLTSCGDVPKEIVSNKGENHSRAKVYINLETGVFYHGIREASESISHISYNSLKFMLLGRYLNTSYIVNADDYVNNPETYLQEKEYKKVINVKTRELYKSVMDVAKIYGIEVNKLRDRITAKNNKSGFMFLDEYENHPNKDSILSKPKNKTSKYVGIYYCKKDRKWLAKYKKQGKNYTIGYYPTEEDAYAGYKDYFNKYPELEPKGFKPLI